MSASKDTKRGTWKVYIRYIDWMGNKQIKTKRGFQTKKEALAWEREFLQSQSKDMNMSFKAFAEIYMNDMKPRIRESTMENKRSQLTEYMATVLPGSITDWTLYTNRRRMIRVLRYAVEQGIIKVTDGADDSFMDDVRGEVLYENTGASKWFVRNFPKDIISYASPEDFRESEWFEVDEDRGFARRHRVYKRLLFAPAMYREDGSGEDFEYLKNYRGRLIDELEQLFDCHVHIHRGSAYVLAGDECKIGTVFPGNNSLADILLLCFGEIRRKIESGEWKTTPEEMCIVDKITFETLIKEVKHTYGSGFAKMYRDMPEGEFVENVTEEMERWMFLKKEDDMHQIKICPLTGKIQGSYPQDYMGGTEDEQQMAGE